MAGPEAPLMLNYAARRVPQIIPTLILASIVTFTLLRLVPGDVADVLAVEGAVSEESKVRIREELGFDDPAPVQYLHWLGDLVTADLGHSYWTNRPVHELFRHALPKTVELAVLA
ncbi:MAG: ABC transporter permease, partial [Dehalococcoidia bacterium]|nr:ABC transporter permease [Dehalococcoidia bacterium]